MMDDSLSNVIYCYYYTHVCCVSNLNVVRVHLFAASELERAGNTKISLTKARDDKMSEYTFLKVYPFLQ